MGLLSALIRRFRPLCRPKFALGAESAASPDMRIFPVEVTPGLAGTGSFAPSFKPFKPVRKNEMWVERKQQAELDKFGCTLTKDTYPYAYFAGRDADGQLTPKCRERFRSKEEMEWASAFDELGLSWEYEPFKFDMGPKHFSYTPDFKVSGLSLPGSNRVLYVETKWFGEEMDATKYVRFTEYYNCDLLVLACGDLW